MTNHVARLPMPSLTSFGLLLGALFFAASLTPSLVPRPTIVQGTLSGLSFTAGYGIGLVLRMLWHALQLPRPAGRARQVVTAVAWALCLAVVVLALWRATGWQDRLRALMDLPPVEAARPLTVSLIALAVFVVIVLVARGAGLIWRALSRWLARRLPGPQAGLIALVLTALLFWNIGNGVLVRAAMQLADASYQWAAPIEWSRLIVSASSAAGPLGRRLLVRAGGIPANCAA